MLCRAWRRFDREAFASDSTASTLCDNLSTLSDVSADDLVNISINRVLTELLARHCPLVTVQRRHKQSTPWFDAECRAARRRVRALERCFDAPAVMTSGEHGPMNSRKGERCRRSRTGSTGRMRLVHAMET